MHKKGGRLPSVSNHIVLFPITTLMVEFGGIFCKEVLKAVLHLLGTRGAIYHESTIGQKREIREARGDGPNEIDRRDILS